MNGPENREDFLPLSHYELASGRYSYMTCHWTDVERGIVVPKYSGQIFYFADIDSMWVYVEPAPEREPIDGISKLVVFIFLAGLLLLVLLSAEVLRRKGWLL